MRARLHQALRVDQTEYKWWALSCTSLGMLMATINSGTLIIALPDLERALHTGLLPLVWVILSYLIASTVLVLTGLPGLVYGISRGGISGWNDPLVIGGLLAAAALLPMFVLVESRGEAPMLDLTIFRNRMFSAATAAAFINGLSRFSLLF